MGKIELSFDNIMDVLGGLQIAMYYAAAVNVLQCLQNLSQTFPHCIDGLLRLVNHPPHRCFTILHLDVHYPIILGILSAPLGL